MISSNFESATFGTGCFWCTEAVFQQLKGVQKVTSGYSGGQVPSPIYDPEQISFTDLLEVFWKTHDPTTLNRQGGDVGTQYRSVIFYHNESQKELAAKYKLELDASGAYTDPIVTTLEPFTIFYPAESYHLDYYNNNSNQGYCQLVIRPKLEKFEKVFRERLRS